MEATFSEYETGIIRNMMLNKSAKDIGQVLDMDPADIKKQIASLSEAAGVISYQQKLDEKMAIKKAATLNKPRLPRVRIQKKSAAKIKSSNEKRLEKENERLRREQIKLAAKREKMRQSAITNPGRRPPAYKTAIVDYTKLVTVKIDRTTSIYAKPGEEEATKARFLKTFIKPIDNLKI